MAFGFERRIAPNGVAYLHCAALGVPHGFSTRQGGQSVAPYDSLNLGMSSGDARETVLANRGLWALALGFDLPIFTLHQVHGAMVYDLAPDDLTPPAALQGDAIVCAAPGRAIGVFTADCAPILLAAPESGVVAAVHAGWRGTVAGVAGNVVRQMMAAHGVPATAIRAAIGPTIGPCCFEVGDEVAAAFEAEPFRGAGAAVVPGKAAGRSHVDLFAANVSQLEAEGLALENIHASRICTVCEATDYYSWRREQGQTGRMQAVIALPPGGARHD